MSLLTYLQQIPSKLAQWKRLRSLPHYTLEELGLSELAITAAELPALTLRQYIDLVSDVPLPTQQQKENFIEYVSHAHSWYKHLPVYPPGVPFYFFIDKYAGCDRLVSEDGTAILQERTEPGFHYSDYPTAKYRDLFGHLAYSCGYGTKVIALSKGPMVIPHDDLAAVPGNDGRPYRLPPEVIDAGLTQLTAAIHPHSAFNPLWFRHMPKDSRQIDWPEESGGRLALEKLIERADTIERRWPAPMETVRINLPMSGVLKTVDAVLNELLSPERTRQYGEMMKAIDRVCELIAANKK
jgi:hypothetical protein